MYLSFILASLALADLPLLDTSAGSYTSVIHAHTVLSNAGHLLIAHIDACSLACLLKCQRQYLQYASV